MRRANRMLSILPLLLVVACGGDAPAAPAPASPIPANFEGVWRGDLFVTRCLGQLACMGLIGENLPFELRLRQTGNRVTGIFQRNLERVEVDGVIDPGGQLTLSGRQDVPSPWLHLVEIRQFVVSLERSGALTGDIEYLYDQRGNPDGRGVYGGRLSSRIHQPLNSTSVSGEWQGHYVVRDCTNVGWRSCHPWDLLETPQFSLSVTQTGTSLSGELRLGGTRIPITGMLTSDGLTLNGETTEPVSGGASRVRLLSFEASPNKLGVLKGEFRYEDAFIRADGPVSGTTYDAELWFVIHR